MVILDERNFLVKELDQKGFNVFDFFENHQVISYSNFCQLPLQRRSDFLLIDTATVIKHLDSSFAQFQSVLNTFLGVIFFHEHQNQKAQGWVEGQAAFLNKIVGEYSLPMPQLEWTMLSNQLQFFWNLIQEQKNLQKHMTEFSKELDQVLQTAEWEMSKAKKIHEILIPKRNDEIKGIFFSNKYASGSGAGGEFYDLLHVGQKVFQIIVSSQSYLISSSLMGILNQHKQNGFEPTVFINDCTQEILTINGAKKKKSDVEVIVLEIDCSQLSMKAHGWGKIECISHLNGNIDLGLPSQRGEEKKTVSYQLTKGEKLIVFSEGFLFNWKEGKVKRDLNSFIKSNHNLSLSDLMMELFFQLKHEKNADFLSKDATVVTMEVNRHGIHQI